MLLAIGSAITAMAGECRRDAQAIACMRFIKAITH